MKEINIYRYDDDEILNIGVIENIRKLNPQEIQSDNRIRRNFIKILSESGLWTDIRIPSVGIR